MKHKKTLFSILEGIEKKNIEKEIINIKNLNITQKKITQQLTLLMNYKKEYLQVLRTKIASGVSVQEWKNYNDFITVLYKVIQDNEEIVEKNRKKLEESLNIWSKIQIKLKTWQYLNEIDKKKLLRIKKIHEQTLHDNYAQLNIFYKKDKYYNV